jgi:hypothetical protein
MMRRMVRAQRPHCALQPRQPYTWLVERGASDWTAERTSLSLKTLQEQTIIDLEASRTALSIARGIAAKQRKSAVFIGYLICEKINPIGENRRNPAAVAARHGSAFSTSL